MQTGYILDSLITAGLGNRYDSRKTGGVLSGMNQEDWEELWHYADLHQIWGIVGEGLRHFPDIKIPENAAERFRQAEENLAYQYYYMLSFTTYVTDLLAAESIPCYVLKGIALNAMYPREEMRKLADADVYVPDRKDFERADRILRQRGFMYERGFADFHSGYTKQIGERSCLLELHWRPCEEISDRDAERAVTEIYGGLPYAPDTCRVSGVMVPVLPPAEFAFQLLLHMLQHFVHEGFGLRLLCDWSVFWKEKGSGVPAEKFLSYLHRTGLEGFAWTVTQICIDHMGLDKSYVEWLGGIDGRTYRESTDMLYTDIIYGGEFGKGEKSRMMIFQNGSSVLVSCVRAVHHAMKFRFPRACRWIPAWPFLWGMTIAVFLKNNRRLDRGETGEIIKSAKKREKLLKQMKIFG
ncbi:nucleotidyltransferase domain-containing protein [Lachnoclostridium sp. An169]|uniref:nucleotidyltransferase domain-containing protein n=1 Tax=Lachnoclostridium sp. An169 TaxID=1965569 RepID=UPI000B3A7EE9|nr:nucleotidyltransferase family protein [Lachnoclostridium sp. An169]